jgi:hypothetical protein
VDEAQARRRSLFSDAASALPSRTELRSLWPTLSITEQRRLLASVFDCIVVRANGHRAVEERIVVVLHGEAPADLPGRGKQVPFRAFDLPEDARVPLTEDGHDGAVERPKRRAGQKRVAA